MIRYCDVCGAYNDESCLREDGSVFECPRDFVKRVPRHVEEKLAATLEKALMSEEARKDDDGKLRFDLVPPEVTLALASVLTYGAAKYGDRNWEKGMPSGRVYAALQRHLTAWHMGHDADEDSGLPHSWHAVACLAFLIAYESRGIQFPGRNLDLEGVQALTRNAIATLDKPTA